MFNKENLEEHFKYHPPLTQERIDKHDIVNKAALEFFKSVSSTIDDEYYLKLIFQEVQICRMIANQAVTIEEVNDINAHL